MPLHSSPDPSSPSLRAKIIGLGERSIRKSYYPELQKKLQTISQMNEQLERRVEERTAELVAANMALSEQIAERQQAEKSLEQVLQTLRDFHSIVNWSPAIVFRLRVGGKWPLEFVSDNFAQFGYSAAELLSGQIAWPDIVHPDDIGRLVSELTHHVQEGTQHFSQEYRIITRSGEIRWVEDRNQILTDASGVATHIQGIMLDVTERKQAADKLKRLYRALEQRAGQLRALACELTEAEERERRRLAQVLHDHLQQILVAAKLRLDRLARRLHDEPIGQSLRQTTELLDQALTESRSLTAELSPPVLYDAGLIAGLDWLARQMQARHGLKVHLDLDTEAAQVAEDIVVFLFQAVRELLFNVVKHAQTDCAQVRMTRSSPTKVQIVVADQGVGFDPAELEHREVAEGFGLFSIRERVSFLGGQFHVDSAPGRGTRMIIEAPLPDRTADQALPRSREPRKPPLFAIPREAAERLVQPAAAPRVRPIRVLLADDHPVLRKGLADLLREHLDIDVVAEASDGEEAVHLAHRTYPDVILMDVTMPRMDGVEATRRIAAALPEVRIIGLSMHEASDMAHAMYEAGACLYLNKSTPGDALTAAIRDQVLAPAPCGKAAR